MNEGRMRAVILGLLYMDMMLEELPVLEPQSEWWYIVGRKQR